MHGHAYITEPPLSKTIDRTFRTLSYLALVDFGMKQLIRNKNYAYEATFSQDWIILVCAGLIVVGIVSACATAFGRAQIEYVSLPMVLAMLGSLILYSLATIGLSSILALMSSLWFLLCARYMWIHLAVKRARIVQRITKGD